MQKNKQKNIINHLQACPSVSLQGIEHVVLAYIESDPLQDPQATGLQQQQPAGPQTLTHPQTLGHADGLQPLHPAQGLVLHKHLADTTQRQMIPGNKQPML